MAAYSKSEGRLTIDTIYIGGGTPSELPVNAWPELRAAIDRHFEVRANTEFTVEMNPESIDAAYLAGLRAIGVNRLSLGVQSMNEAELKFLGRAHTASDVQNAAEIISDSGIRNWSVDLIYALPDSTVETVRQSLAQLIALEPTHLSVYELTIEPSTRFDRLRIQPQSAAIQLDQYRHIQTELSQAGFQQYEFSAFGKPGYRSEHNWGYWELRPYIGIGPGAHSFYRNTRYANRQPFPHYLENSDPEIGQKTQSPESVDALISDFVMVQLRLAQGLDLELAQRRWGISILKQYGPPIERLIGDGFLFMDGHFLRATEKGWPLIDRIALEILSE